MTAFIFSPKPPVGIPVMGSAKLFPARRIYCIGRNYAAHAREMGGNPDREPPFFFMKPGDAVQVVHNSKLAKHSYPPGTSDYHHELELVAVLRKGGRDITKEAALDHVFGYAVGLDMTRRDRQSEAKKLQRPWEIGKSGENSAVVGPITPRGRAGNILASRMELIVNGAVRQKASVADMIWSLEEQIAILSQYFTLCPGDMIMTGTPEGVNSVVRGDVMEGCIGALSPIRLKVV
ncbi:MAG: fumarylacetoacetate hydrolase family protein [Beijerinckiaceae bacterium]